MIVRGGYRACIGPESDLDSEGGYRACIGPESDLERSYEPLLTLQWVPAVRVRVGSGELAYLMRVGCIERSLVRVRVRARVRLGRVITALT